MARERRNLSTIPVKARVPTKTQTATTIKGIHCIFNCIVKYAYQQKKERRKGFFYDAPSYNESFYLNQSDESIRARVLTT